VHTLAERLLGQIRREEFLRAGDRVGVAVSGGIDSVALLQLLLELRSEVGIVLSVVHFNHKLRGAESDEDQEFVTNLGREHGLEFYCDSEDVAAQAAQERISVETAAREFRYGFFRHLLGEDSDEENPPKLDKIATGHTLDDQAETVLMRMVRGTGFRGLGGIHPRVALEDLTTESAREIIRPLLGIRRCELEQYLNSLGQSWREDSSNADARFTRNRVRKLVLPLLEREFNPGVAEGLSELAEIARGEEDYWENEVSGWFGTAVQWSEPEWARGIVPGSGGSQSLVQITPANPELMRRLQEPGPLVMNASVSRAWLLTEPVAVQRRVVKAIGDRAGIPLEFKHIEEILRFAGDDTASGGTLSLPLGWKAAKEPEALVFVTPDLRAEERIPQDYEYPLPLPGRALVPETGTVVEALRVKAQTPGDDSVQVLDPATLPSRLTVRNWRPGDRFWPAHTKSPKKIKELLQERQIPLPERRLWPVVVNGDEIVWVRGFPAPARLQAKRGGEGVLIRETPLAEGQPIT
jgi:tRNA(Ile)-lysidine synthase